MGMGWEEGGISYRRVAKRSGRGSDLYKHTIICVCVRFSSAVHTGLVEGQISSERKIKKVFQLEKKI